MTSHITVGTCWLQISSRTASSLCVSLQGNMNNWLNHQGLLIRQYCKADTSQAGKLVLRGQWLKWVMLEGIKMLEFRSWNSIDQPPNNPRTWQNRYQKSPLLQNKPLKSPPWSLQQPALSSPSNPSSPSSQPTASSLSPAMPQHQASATSKSWTATSAMLQLAR